MIDSLSAWFNKVNRKLTAFLRKGDWLDSILALVFGTKHDREIKAILPLIAAINALEPAMQVLSDQELAEKTIEFRQKLEDRKSVV